MKKYIAHRILQGYINLTDKENSLYFLLKCIFSVFFNFKLFLGYEIDVDLEQKQSILASFESQQDVLKSYNTYYKKTEFLYLEERGP